MKETSTNKQINYEWNFVFKNVDKEAISSLEVELTIDIDTQKILSHLEEALKEQKLPFTKKDSELVLHVVTEEAGRSQSSQTFFNFINSSSIKKGIIESGEEIQVSLSHGVINCLIFNFITMPFNMPLTHDEALSLIKKLPEIKVILKGRFKDGRRIKQELIIYGTAFHSPQQLSIEFFKNYNNPKIAQIVSVTTQ